MGRYRKYRSDKQLRPAVEAYFASISREKLVMEFYNTGKKDGWGHWILEWRPVSDRNGVPMREREYMIPPTVGGLCAYLNISRATWYQYCQEEKFRETTEWAREQLLAWREEQLLRRPGKMVKGLTAEMEQNFGYGTAAKEGGGAPAATGRETSAAALPLEEREQLLKDLAEGFGHGEE